MRGWGETPAPHVFSSEWAGNTGNTKKYKAIRHIR